MQRELIEYVHSGGVRLRSDGRGVLSGVKLLGLKSKNGNRYLPAALQQASQLYEGAKVHVNHPPRGQEHQPRDYRDRLGTLRNVEVRDDGLYADLHFNPKHPLAEQLLWDAQHAPENVGFSHNATGRGRQQDDAFLVEEIVKVRSVDLVTDPATTRGLFEGEQRGRPLNFDGLTVEDLQHERPDLVRAIVEAHHTETVQQLQTELEQYRRQAARNQRRQALLRRCREQKLPETAISEIFVQSLLEAADDEAVCQLIEDRRRLVAAHRAPQSRSPDSLHAVHDGKEMAALLKG